MSIVLSFLVFLASLFCSVTAYGGNTMEELINFLSSEKLEGRKPGQEGNSLATNFIKEKLETSGLVPLGRSYFQEFTIFTQMSKIGKNSFEFEGSSAEFQPISYSLNGELKNTAILFAGFGISIPKNDPELIYDDYQGVDAKGKIVAILTGDPGIGNLNSKFRKMQYQNYSSLFYKLKNAISHGARGIIIIQNPLNLPNYPLEEPLFFNNTEGGGSRFSIIAGRVTNNDINKYFPKEKKTIDIQKIISKGQTPHSFNLKINGNLSVELKKSTGRVSNIIGVKKGSDPSLQNEVVVIGAHMDHLGFGGESSMDPQGMGKIHNGADDNASGTALVLKLADKMANIKTKRTFVFSLFNAEEMGLLGSQHFVDMWASHTKDYGKIVAMLNYDMVGRYKDQLTVMGAGSSRTWSNLLALIESHLNIQIKDSLVGSSDHAPFIQKKIPSLLFTTGAHEDYHRSTDTSEKINIEAMKRLERLSLTFIQKIDAQSKLSYNPDFSTEEPGGGSNRGYGAHLGCVPEFGQADDIIGVVCMRASENSPAMGAGIISGDILVQIGTIEVKNIYDLTFALKYYRAGDEVEIAWKRGNSLLKQKIILKKSSRS